MSSMLAGGRGLNQTIGRWTVLNVTDVLFVEAEAHNQDFQGRQLWEPLPFVPHSILLK